jgi:hypothetical protein
VYNENIYLLSPVVNKCVECATIISELNTLTLLLNMALKVGIKQKQSSVANKLRHYESGYSATCNTNDVNERNVHTIFNSEL